MKTTATPVSAVPAARGDVAAANPMQLLEEQMKRFTVSKTPVQRVYMENQKRLRDEMTRDGSEAANALKLAVEAYAAADDRVRKEMGEEAPGAEILPGLNELTERLLTVGQRAALIRPVLVSEAQQVSDDLIACAEWIGKMDDADWQNDPDNIVEAGKDLLTRYGKYQVTYNGNDNQTVYKLLGYLLEKKRTLDRMWEGERGEEGEEIPGKAVDGKEGYQWGDKEGRLSEENRNMLEDFNTLKAFMDNKSLVLSFLTPLATAVSGEEDKLGALRRALRRQEQSAGFNSPPRIPLGILPTETFFALLRKGRVLDDYGVGLKHGELTHRLQWYAIIEAAKSGGMFHSTVNQLYRQMGKEPRTGDPKWGAVLDDGNEVNSDSYSSPGTFNRDLQESTGPKTGTAFPDRSGYENPVGLEALAPIGEALAALRQTRLQQAVHATDKGNDYEEEAFPPPSVIALLVAKMRQQPNAFKLAEEDYVGHEFMAQRDKYAVWKQTDNSIEKDTLTWGKPAPAKWLTPFNAAAVAGLSVVFFAALHAYNKLYAYDENK